MTLPDALIAVVQLSFGLAMLPTVLGPSKPAPWSCWHTAAGLTLLGVIFATLGLWLAAAGCWGAAVSWWALVWQVSHPGLRAYLDAHPEIAEEASEGFRQIDEGRCRSV